VLVVWFDFLQCDRLPVICDIFLVNDLFSHTVEPALWRKEEFEATQENIIHLFDFTMQHRHCLKAIPSNHADTFSGASHCRPFIVRKEI
jgi:hypothetical protein